MTLKVKRFLFNSGTAVSLINTLLISGLFILQKIPTNFQTLTILIMTIISLIAMVIIYLLYNKILGGEVVFFTLFLLCGSLQSVRLLPLLIPIESFIFYSVISRTAYFLKFVALFSLLGASLFTFSIKKQKIGSWILLSLLAALTISSIVVLHSNYNETELISPVIYKGQDFVLTGIIIVITLLNYIKSSFDSKNREYIFMGISSFIVAMSFQTLFLPLSLATLVVTVSLALTGAILFLRSIHNISLWS